MFTIDSNELRQIFADNKRVAIVGLSRNPMRAKARDADN